MDKYIKMQEAINAFDDNKVERYYGDVNPESVIEVIKTIPAADVREVVRGKWNEICKEAIISGMDEYPILGCSQCDFQIYDIVGTVKERYNFCPNCGADMREAE